LASRSRRLKAWLRLCRDLHEWQRSWDWQWRDGNSRQAQAGKRQNLKKSKPFAGLKQCVKRRLLWLKSK
jgi:hypothetical protein